MNMQNSPRFDFVIDTELGEHKILGEDQLLNDLENLFTTHFRRTYQEPSVPAQRAVHAKSHGCLKATFEVLDHGDPDLDHGIFKKPAHYESIVRFSNGDGPAGPDTDKLVSVGLGIKVLGVTEPKLLSTQIENSQDFLMINQPAFIVADIRGFKRIIEAREGGLFKKVLAFLYHWKGFRVRASTSPKDNPFNLNYWSVTPFQLGGTTVKYLARPSEPEPPNIPEPLTDHYLRQLVKQWIESRPASFEFFLQKRVFDGKEAKEMPIEDSTVIWNEAKSVPIRVARLIIPVQSVDSLDENAFCENLVFSPWNSTMEFRPMSSLNRARKVIYELSSRHRHALNATDNPLV